MINSYKIKKKYHTQRNMYITSICVYIAVMYLTTIFRDITLI